MPFEFKSSVGEVGRVRPAPLWLRLTIEPKKVNIFVGSGEPCVDSAIIISSIRRVIAMMCNMPQQLRGDRAKHKERCGGECEENNVYEFFQWRRRVFRSKADDYDRVQYARRERRWQLIPPFGVSRTFSYHWLFKVC